MPTNPTTPKANASVDRLALGIDSPRGVEPSFPIPSCVCNCFEAEASGYPNSPQPSCFEAEASTMMPPCSVPCMCFEEA